MADVYGTQMTKVNSVPMKMGDAHSMGGRMRILSDTYTYTINNKMYGRGRCPAAPESVSY